MKGIKFLVGFLMVLFFLGAQTTMALPTLQLDISDGIYIAGSEESVFATSDVFTLYALYNTKNLNESETFYISAAIVSDDQAGSGSFSFDSTTVNVESMTYGTPSGLPKHGIFETNYWEYAFTFDADNKSAAYNVEDSPGGFQESSNGKLYFAAFDVDVSGLGAGTALHFDLYHKDQFGNVDFNAPFSHDAQSVSSGGNGGSPVPEPATMILLGCGIAGIAAFRRKKVK